MMDFFVWLGARRPHSGLYATTSNDTRRKKTHFYVSLIAKHYTRLLVVFLCVIAPMLASNAHAHGVTLKVQHFLPADSPFHTQFLMPWLAKLESESHGLLRFQVYPAMQMGGTASQLYDQVKEGAADIVWTSAALNPKRFPAFAVFNLPLMTNSSQGSSRALWEYVQAQDLARSEFTGVRLLAVHVATIKSVEQAPASSDAKTSSDTFVLAMNSAVYKSLSDELKKVIIANSGADTSTWLGKIADAAIGKPVSGAATEIAQKTIEDRIKQLDALGLDGKQLIESARALIAEHDPPKR
jgi:TRAP-type C4-dicarboxylate transport system substrate-binding protein